MDGKVEVSILQWEKIRKEHGELTQQVEQLKQREKKVTLVIQDKQFGTHLKYNRFNDRNEFISEEKTVESVSYVGLEDIIRVLREEEADKVKGDITRLEMELDNADHKILQLKKSHEKNINDLKEDHLDEIESMGKEFEQLKKSHSEEIDKLKKEIEELKGTAVKSEDELEIIRLKEIIEDLRRNRISLIEKLEIAKSQIPWWRR